MSAQFIRVAPRVTGVHYQTDRPTAPGLGLIVMHDFQDFLDHPAAVQLAQRGFEVLAVNPSYGPTVEDRETSWDQALIDLGSAMNYLKGLPHIKTVVLVGHSSGAPLMACYQNIAENGVTAACQGPEKILPGPDTLTGFTPSDGLVLLDPIFGVAANFLTSVDPAVISDANPKKLDPNLDMYSAANGASSEKAAYSDQFRHRYFAQQARRNAQIVSAAQRRLAAIRAGEGMFDDDEPFVVPGATRVPSLWRPDIGLLERTKSEYLLLQPTRMVKQTIRSVRPPQGLSRMTSRLAGGALNTTVKRFLNTFATRSRAGYAATADSFAGVDWLSSYNSTPGNLAAVKAPVLVLAMTGHYWIVSAELAFEHSVSRDKSIAFVDGATHGFMPVISAGATQDRYGDTMKTTFDYVGSWLSARH